MLVCYTVPMIRNHYEIGQADYEEQQEAIQRELEAEREREAAEVLEPDQFMSEDEEDHGYFGIMGFCED